MRAQKGVDVVRKAIEALGNAILSLWGNWCPDCKKWKAFWDYDPREWTVCDRCLNMRYWDFKFKQESKAEKEKQQEEERKKIESTQHGLRGGA